MSKTFDENFAKQYEEACKRNKGQHDIYHCATASGITGRNLNLDSEYVFTEFCSIAPKKNATKEYKLQAYMIKSALKELSLRLPIRDKDWIFLDAERTFVESDLNEASGHKRLDILAYEKSTLSYIVLELKTDRSLTTASNELFQYTSTIKKHINSANACYSVAAKNVQGYIVWPSNENPKENREAWGLIEYDKKFLDAIENIELNVVKEPS